MLLENSKTSKVQIDFNQMKTTKNHQNIRLELKGYNHKYLSLISEQSNQSMTMYINQLIDEDKKEKTELYKHLVEMQKKIEELKRI